jgi:hypothetical protein
MADEFLDRVIWGDAFMETAQQTADEMSHEPFIVRTAGTIVHDTVRGIWIAPEDIPGASPTGFRGHTFIPRPLIIAVEKYRKVKPRKPRAKKEGKVDETSSVGGSVTDGGS